MNILNIFRNAKVEPVLHLIYFIVFKFLGTMVTRLCGIEGTAMTLSIATLISTVLTVSVFCLRRWWKGAEDMRAAASCKWETYVLTCIATLSVLIPSAWMMEQLPELPDLVQNEFEKLMQSWWGLIALTICAPIGEEVVFRGSILRSLLSQCNKKWTAITISAIIFSLIHGNPAQMPHAFLIGLLLGWLYERYKTIAVTILFHWVNNTTAYIVGHYYSYDSKLTDILGSETTITLAVIVSIIIFATTIHRMSK